MKHRSSRIVAFLSSVMLVGSGALSACKKADGDEGASEEGGSKSTGSGGKGGKGTSKSSGAGGAEGGANSAQAGDTYSAAGDTSAGGTTAAPTAGAIGAACGTCDDGLTCAMEVPGGYCSKDCTSNADCGDGAFCYNLAAGGAVCLAACDSDGDCREGYTCQGDAGSTICYIEMPGGPTCGADLFGGWWGLDPCGTATCEQYAFYENGTFDYELWSGVSGTIPDSGTWQISCPNLTATFSDKVVNFTIQNGVLYEAGQYTYAHCSDRCF